MSVLSKPDSLFSLLEEQTNCTKAFIDEEDVFAPLPKATVCHMFCCSDWLWFYPVYVQGHFGLHLLITALVKSEMNRQVTGCFAC